MSVPQLRFKEFSGSVQVKALRDISKLITKGTTPRSFVDEGINFIKIESLEGKTINAKKCAFIDQSTHNNELKRSVLVEGDLLFAIAGATIGKCSVVTPDILPANTNQALAIVRLSNHESREYIYHILSSHKMRRYILDNISVGAQPNLNLEQMGNFSFYYPDKYEQAKIAIFLTAVDEKISQLTQKSELLTQYKKGVIQQIFSQQLRFKDEDGREFAEWEECALGDLCSTFKSGVGITSEKITEHGNYPVFGGNGLRGYADTFTHDGYYVLIGRQGAQCGNINRSRGKAYISEHAIAVNSNENSDTEWLAQQLDYMKLNRLSESSAQPGLSVNKIVKLKINSPSKAEQTKIANFLTAIDDKITNTQAQLAAAKQYKQGLLQQMFV